MNRFRYEALVEEFPFLPEVIFDFEDPSNAIRLCEYIAIKRLDEAILNITPMHETYHGSLTHTDDEQAIHFILDDQSIIMGAVTPKRSQGSDNSWSEQEGETILEAIYRHNVAERLKYAVITHIGYEKIQEGSRSSDKWNAKVYKLPKYTTLSAEIERAQQKARGKVRTEADF